MDPRSPEHNKLVDEEDDEEDVIIYKEQTVQVPFPLSQVSAAQPEKITVSCPVAKTNFLSRHERRKRRHEWRERQLADEQQVDSQSQESPSVEQTEDAFASLRSLLDQSQQSREFDKENDCSQKAVTESSKKCLQPSSKDSKTRCKGQTEQIGDALTTSQQRIPEQEPSPPDFIVFNGNQEDSDSGSDPPDEAKLCFNKNASSMSDGLTKIRRKKLMEKIRRRTSSSSFPETSFATPQSPIGLSKNRRDRASSSTNLSSQISLSSNIHGQSCKVRNAGSIASTRPTHWQRNGNQQRRSTEAKQTQRLAKATALAAATRMSRNKSGRPSLNQGNRQRREKVNIRSNRSASPTGTKNDPSQYKPKSISFKPSFALSFATKAAEQVDEGRDDFSFVPPFVPPRNLPINPDFSSPPPKRMRGSKKKLSSGVWTRRLASIQNARSNASIRLQNKAFRENNPFDLNDPRKQAKSSMDLTIVGDCSGHWAPNLAVDAKVTVLGYIHRYGLIENERLIHDNEFAWVSFPLTAARSVGLKRGLQLRLYDGVVIRCRQKATIDEKIAKGYRTNECCHLVVCTHLCEPYPAELESLPAIIAEVDETNRTNKI